MVYHDSPGMDDKNNHEVEEKGHNCFIRQLENLLEPASSLTTPSWKSLIFHLYSPRTSAIGKRESPSLRSRQITGHPNPVTAIDALEG